MALTYADVHPALFSKKHLAQSNSRTVTLNYDTALGYAGTHVLYLGLALALLCRIASATMKSW